MLKSVFFFLMMFLIFSCDSENVSMKKQDDFKKEKLPEPESTSLNDDDLLRIIEWPDTIYDERQAGNILNRLLISEELMLRDLEKNPIIGPMTFTAIADAAGIHGIYREKKWVKRMLKFLVLKDKIAGFDENGENFTVTFFGSNGPGKKISNTKSELLNIDKIMKKIALITNNRFMRHHLTSKYNEALYQRVLTGQKNIIKFHTERFGNFIEIDKILNNALREHRMVAWARKPAANGETVDFFIKLTDDDIGIMPRPGDNGVTYYDAKSISSQ